MTLALAVGPAWRQWLSEPLRRQGANGSLSHCADAAKRRMGWADGLIRRKVIAL